MKKKKTKTKRNLIKKIRRSRPAELLAVANRVKRVYRAGSTNVRRTRYDNIILCAR